MECSLRLCFRSIIIFVGYSNILLMVNIPHLLFTRNIWIHQVFKLLPLFSPPSFPTKCHQCQLLLAVCAQYRWAYLLSRLEGALRQQTGLQSHHCGTTWEPRRYQNRTFRYHRIFKLLSGKWAFQTSWIYFKLYLFLVDGVPCKARVARSSVYSLRTVDVRDDALPTRQNRVLFIGTPSQNTVWVTDIPPLFTKCTRYCPCYGN